MMSVFNKRREFVRFILVGVPVSYTHLNREGTNQFAEDMIKSLNSVYARGSVWIVMLIF